MGLAITDDRAAQEAAFYQAPEWQRQRCRKGVIQLEELNGSKRTGTANSEFASGLTAAILVAFRGQQENRKCA